MRPAGLCDAQLYLNYLRSEGYLPSIDSDGDVVFKIEGRTYFIEIDDRDPEYFRLVFPNFWPIESEAERKKVDVACIRASMETKVAKVVPVRDNVWAMVEMFCSPPDVFKGVFQRSLSALRSSVNNFSEHMRRAEAH